MVITMDFVILCSVFVCLFTYGFLSLIQLLSIKLFQVCYILTVLIVTQLSVISELSTLDWEA